MRDLVRIYAGRYMQGQESFQGEVLFARDLTTDALPQLKGKRVVVLGSGKSSVDACAAAAEVAGSTVNLFRKVRMQSCDTRLRSVNSSVLTRAQCMKACTADPIWEILNTQQDTPELVMLLVLVRASQLPCHCTSCECNAGLQSVVCLPGKNAAAPK